MTSMLPTPKNANAQWKAIRTQVNANFNAYATWLVGMSWWRFFLIAILLLISMNMLQGLLPTSVKVVESSKQIKWKNLNKSKDWDPKGNYEIQIDEHGVRIGPAKPSTEAVPAVPAVPAPPAVPSVPSMPAPGTPAKTPTGLSASLPVTVHVYTGLPAPTPAAAPPAQGDRVTWVGGRRVIELAPVQVSYSRSEHAAEIAQMELEDALNGAESANSLAAKDDNKDDDADDEDVVSLGLENGPRVHIVKSTVLTDIALWWILASIIIKLAYRGRLQAEFRADAATQTAESEALRRQVTEARLAAMQAQVEPHFLFNTLASIDHLIETDPPRASLMQKSLIALLRAAMPTMRETTASNVRPLGRELEVIRPYLDILKMRMEDRLDTQVDVPAGLYTAAFPPMMIQSLVENAIRHGLEPKPEGGSLKVSAQIVDGQLAVSVADTGVGFGNASTGGSGVGLANIRERLQLLYGDRAHLSVAQNAGAGTIVTISLPYQVQRGNSA